MRGTAAVALLALAGCDHLFDLTKVEGGPPTDDAGMDTLADAPPITITFGETGTASQAGVTFDTYLDSVAPTMNFGATGHILIDGVGGPSTGLLRFDISAIPPGATILSATLELSTFDNASTDPVQLIPLLETWDEGDLSGAAGAASWNESTPGQPWSAPGASPPSRGTNVVGTFTPSAQFTRYVVTLDPSVVSGWLANPAGNFGIALVGSGADGSSIASSEHTNPAARPELTIAYAAP